MNGRWQSRALLIGAAALLLAKVPAAAAQSGANRQDSTLNNLEHPPGYATAPLGSLGAIVRRGSGPIDVLIIPGWGFGAEVFEVFMRENASRYRMVAVTLPGFGGTSAPPMPPAGRSYAEATWIRAAEEAIARAIEKEQLRKPIVVGHFIIGTQLALRLALDHSDLIGGMVIVGGEPMRYRPSRRDTTGQTLMSREERVTGIDDHLAPRWFKTVTKQTFDANNFPAAQYSRDTARAAELWKISSDVPLPVMIRYLCEYWAMDLTDEFPRIAVPTRVLAPAFTPDMLADPKLFLKSLYLDSWQRVRSMNAGIETQTVPDSRIFITDDQPTAVRDAIDEVGSARQRR